MRVAWFSPLPPVRSGIAAYSAEVLPHLAGEFAIDTFVDRADDVGKHPNTFSAHDFVWKHQLQPYDLTVYQLGNAPCHDYMWAYLVRYPGLVVLHDARLHQARARQLLQQGRFDDYRQEFHYDHPDAVQDFAEYAVEGLSGSIYYFWSMLRVVVTTARLVAVHNPRVADELRAEFAGVTIEAIRMGVPLPDRHAPDTRALVRDALTLPADAVVFAALGKVTPEKRIGAILRALAALKSDGVPAYLMLVGDAESYPTLVADLARLGVAEYVRVTGYVPDAAIGDYLSAADVCLCLRWPTALETSASLLRCLAAARATVISDLAHLVDVPVDVAQRIDLLEEDRELAQTMRVLASDGKRRDALALNGHRYWQATHTLDIMAADYRRLLHEAAARPAPAIEGLPAHFTADHMTRAFEIARTFAVDVDLLGSGRQ
jgi:glycosyltransferase involved in cell wall biosynthesis